MDASKAFDRLEFCCLFKKLIKRNLCGLVVRLLLYMYMNQLLDVKWNNHKSSTFKVTNGVKQGGVISPVLYCIYIDDLLEILKKSSFGCFIGNNYCGALGYDLILLSPTVYGMKRLIQICEIYAKDHNIVFNPKKSQILYFPFKKGDLPKYNFDLDKETLSYVNNAKHLGHMISDGVIDVSYIMCMFNKSVNILMAQFGTVSSSVLLKLFIQFCCNFYGITLCNVQSKVFDQFCTLWRKSVRRVLKISRRTHNRLVAHITKSSSIEYKIYARIVKFFVSMLQSNNKLVSSIANRCRYQSFSNIMGKNIIFLENKFKFTKQTRKWIGLCCN